MTYQVSVVIPPGTYSNAALTDTMVRGLAFVGCNSITAPGLTTNGNSDFSSVCTNPTVDDAAGGTSADVDRRVTFGFGTLERRSDRRDPDRQLPGNRPRHRSVQTSMGRA